MAIPIVYTSNLCCVIYTDIYSSNCKVASTGDRNGGPSEVTLEESLPAASLNFAFPGFVSMC
jgi:hypothetical protein